MVVPERVVSSQPEVIELHHHRVQREQVVTTELVGLHTNVTVSWQNYEHKFLITPGK